MWFRALCRCVMVGSMRLCSVARTIRKHTPTHRTAIATFSVARTAHVQNKLGFIEKFIDTARHKHTARSSESQCHQSAGTRMHSYALVPYGLHAILRAHHQHQIPSAAAQTNDGAHGVYCVHMHETIVHICTHRCRFGMHTGKRACVRANYLIGCLFFALF